MLHSRAYKLGDRRCDLIGAVVDTITALTRPEAVVLYAVEGGVWRLVQSDSAIQRDLDAPQTLAEREWQALTSGVPVVCGRDPASLLIPAAARGRLSGVMLVRPAPELAALPRTFVPLLVQLLQRGLEELSGAPVQTDSSSEVDAGDAAEREIILGHLVAHEWNIARVSRVMGVTRMTVYNRMRRLRVPRQRVSKTGKRVRDSEA